MEAPDFFVENLLDLPNGDDMLNDAFFPTNNIAANNSTDSSNANAVDSCNSSISGADNIYPAGGDYDGRCFPDAQFSGELCVPYDAELEWLSNFVEESFSSEDLHKLHFIPAPSSNPPAHHNQQQHYHPHQTDTSRQPNSIYTPVTLVPGKARSKLSRVAPSDWSTRLLMVAPPATATTTSSSDTTFPAAHHLHNPKKSASKRRDASVSADASNGEMRRCLHCAAEKTPQWRTGPMGPKTLCNACGVRYKSGRLVPEYRPAASPTFVSTKHSNSHRKVMELRRQKDMHRHVGHQGHQQQVITASPVGVFGLGGGSMGGADDYLIHHHVGPDYRQLI